MLVLPIPIPVPDRVTPSVGDSFPHPSFSVPPDLFFICRPANRKRNEDSKERASGERTERGKRQNRGHGEQKRESKTGMKEMNRTGHGQHDSTLIILLSELESNGETVGRPSSISEDIWRIVGSL
jgi:hypothetical protein